jgi:hypothetical protein
VERAMRRVIAWVARLLAPEQRAVVLGDFEELGVTGWRALCEIVGLVLLQQAQLWRSWRPWIALIGIAGIAGAALGRLLFAFSVALGLEISAWSHYQVFMNDATLGEVIFRQICFLLITSAGSWTIAYVLGRVSRAAVWLTAPVLYIMVLESFPAWLFYTGHIRGSRSPILMLIMGALFPVNFPALAGFLVPAFLGLRRGLRRPHP